MDAVEHAELYRARVAGAIIVTVLNSLDLILTYWALSRGATEGNPLAVWLIHTKLAIVLKLGLCAGILIGVWRHPSTNVLGLCASWAAVGVYFLVVVLNAATVIVSY